MNNEYIILNKKAIQKRIEELENFYMTARKVGITMDIIDREIEILKEILSQSTPLIPEIEKAFNAGFDADLLTLAELNCTVKDYITNLKLDI